MITRFWGNKQFVEDWINITNIKCSVHTIGSGHRGVYLYLSDPSIDIEEFISKYSGAKSKYAYFYLTASNITKGNPIYVSLRKIGYNYGSKYKIND